MDSLNMLNYSGPNNSFVHPDLCAKGNHERQRQRDPRLGSTWHSPSQLYEPPQPQSDPQTPTDAYASFDTEDAPDASAQSPERVKRPRNAFMIFRSEFNATGDKISTAVERDNRHISRIAGHCWNNMSDEERDFWRKKADQEKVEHMRKYPGYKFSPGVRTKKVKRNVKRNGDDEMERCRVVADLLLKGKQGDELKTALEASDPTKTKSESSTVHPMTPQNGHFHDAPISPNSRGPFKNPLYPPRVEAGDYHASAFMTAGANVGQGPYTVPRTPQGPHRMQEYPPNLVAATPVPGMRDLGARVDDGMWTHQPVDPNSPTTTQSPYSPGYPMTPQSDIGENYSSPDIVTAMAMSYSRYSAEQLSPSPYAAFRPDIHGGDKNRNSAVANHQNCRPPLHMGPQSGSVDDDHMAFLRTWRSYETPDSRRQ